MSRQTDRPTDRPTDRRTERAHRKVSLPISAKDSRTCCRRDGMDVRWANICEGRKEEVDSIVDGCGDATAVLDLSPPN